MKIEIITTEKGQIEYSIVGKGKPILFLHGGHSNCREKLFLKGFDLNKYQIIIPSRPGYGNTPLNTNTTPKKSADLIVLLLNYLGIDKVVLYGISAAGLTAIEMAGNYPERVEKLVLASAISKKWLKKNDKKYNVAKKIFNPRVEKIVWGIIRLFATIFPRIIANNFFPEFSNVGVHRLEKNDINELIETLKYYNSKLGFMNDIEQSDEDSSISKINCPTLIVHSKNDNSVSLEHAKYAKEKIKSSKLIELDNQWGHMFWIGKDSSESIEIIIKFIEG